MKLLIFLFVVIFVQCTISYSASVNWKNRMRKYSELLNCEYYLTSENVYKDYFKLDNGQNYTDYTNHTQYRFYTLSRNAIKFALSDADYNNASFPGNLTNQYEFVIGERSNGSSDDSNDGNAPPIPPGDDGGPSLMEGGGNGNDNGSGNAGSIARITNFINNKNNIVRPSAFESHVLTYVRRGSQRLKSLVTQGIVRTDQPNEFLIEKFEGKIHLTINENTPFEIKVENVNKLNFISFAAAKNYNLEEFFYDCHPN